MNKILAIVAGVVAPIVVVGGIILGCKFIPGKPGDNPPNTNLSQVKPGGNPSNTDLSQVKPGGNPPNTDLSQVKPSKTISHKDDIPKNDLPKDDPRDGEIPDWANEFPKQIQDAIFYDEHFNEALAERMRRRSDSIFEHLTGIEKEAVKNYMGLNNIAAFLRGHKFSSEESKTFASYVDALSGLINKNRLEQDVCLFRGAPVECLNKVLLPGDMEKISSAATETSVEDIIKKLNGKVFDSNDFFVSTSTSCGAAMNFCHPPVFGGQSGSIGVFLIINAKKGTGHLPIMNHSVCKAEREVLLDRHLKLKIKNAMFKLNPHLIHCDKCLFLECETVS